MACRLINCRTSTVHQKAVVCINWFVGQPQNKKFSLLFAFYLENIYYFSFIFLKEPKLISKYLSFICRSFDFFHHNHFVHSFYFSLNSFNSNLSYRELHTFSFQRHFVLFCSFDHWKQRYVYYAHIQCVIVCGGEGIGSCKNVPGHIIIYCCENEMETTKRNWWKHFSYKIFAVFCCHIRFNVNFPLLNFIHITHSIAWAVVQ